MNKVEERKKQDYFVELSEEQQILNEARNIIDQFEVSNRSNARKAHVFIFISAFALILVALFFSTIFSLLNINNTTIIDGVYIQGIDVSNLTKEEATNKLTQYLDKNLSKEVILTHNDYSTTILPSQLNVSFDIKEAVESAYSLGRNSNIFKNNYTILISLVSNINIKPTVTYDTDLLTSIINEVNTNIPDAVVDSSYYIEETNLIITNGKDGVAIDEPILINNLLAAFSDIGEDTIAIDLPVYDISAKGIDIEQIYTEIRKDPVDAYYTTNPYVVYPSSNGVDFNITIEEAKNILSTYQEEYTIPLKTLYPNVTTNQIGTEAFPDLLSKFSTSFSSSNYSRSTNISLAAEKINGIVLMPGEIFSFNQSVGKRTKEAGFKEAPAYLNGEVVQEYGGGICQVSSTLYNAVLYANLEITERHNHGYKPSYVKPGLDATVSWGGPDFKFTNNRNYPIKIVCDSSGKTLRIYIYGLKTDNDYTVVLDTEYLSTVYAKVVYKTDYSLVSGASRVIQSGSNGCKTAAYKYLYDLNGNLVSSECLSRDTYNAHNKIIAVGP